MATESCDICGRDVPIAGGIANLWSFQGDETGGLTLEFDDGSEFFCCFECIRKLPEDPTAEDVERLASEDSDGGVGD